MNMRVSKHIKKLAQKHPAIRKQFFPSRAVKGQKNICTTFLDPLEEYKYETMKGLLHKYPHRVLIMLTNQCAVYCQFCNRKRRTGNMARNNIENKDIDTMVQYVRSKPEINEIIFSGGDPLIEPEKLIYALKQFSRLPQIKIIRISTRLPVSDPSRVPLKKLLPVLQKLCQSVYILIHFNHPTEITAPTKKIIRQFKKAGYHVGGQTVFLKGVNDDYNILYQLFNRLLEIGVVPYNINHCDPVLGADDFICDLDKEIKIMTRLRRNLSGLAFPLHVIDAPRGCGKVPVPTDFWQFKKNEYNDFKDKQHFVNDPS